jgi:hypothetical protein
MFLLCVSRCCGRIAEVSHYFLDTEYNEFGGDLISLALVSEEGDRELYVATGCDNPGAWVEENVLPIVNCKGAIPIFIKPDQFGRAIRLFLKRDNFPTIIVDWPDDISYFCRALITGPGEMVNIGCLRFHMQRVDAYPTDLPGAVQHNALWDARALRTRFVQASALSQAGRE